MIWRFLRRLFRCAHEDTRRERRGTVLMLVCADCDAAFPVAMTDHKKAKRLAARLRQSRQSSPRVVPLRKTGTR